jgi:hypothetical protein
MTSDDEVALGRDLPTPSIDPPEPPRPDELDTWSPGLTDESGELPVSDAAAAMPSDDDAGGSASASSDATTSEPSA